jgi:DNA (cytosine-5)-methyltransferase 1
MLTSRGLGTVLGDLASMGFDAKWGVLGAADVGANHQRDRIWIVAHSKSIGDRRKLRGIYRQDETQWQSKEHWQNTATEFNNGCQDVANTNNAGVERWEQQSECGNSKRNLANTLCNGLQGSGEDGGFERQAGLCSGEGSDKEQDLHMAHPKNEGYVRWFGSMATTESQHDNRGSQTDGGREWWEVEPNVGRVVDGLASRVDRLKAVGNGQVPLCAATAWRLLK